MGIYDIGIIGSGVAGAFALKRFLQNNKAQELIIFDAGVGPLKRKHQIYGFLGPATASDGKFYTNDLKSVAAIAGTKRTMAANRWVLSEMMIGAEEEVKLTKDKRPGGKAEKRIRENGFDLELNHYHQFVPHDIHMFSRSVSNMLDKSKNITMSYNNEVYQVLKQKVGFLVITAQGEFQCKKVLLSVGRGGWRWVSELFSDFGIIENNDTARFGIHIELPANAMKDFNSSNCSLLHGTTKVGPFLWNGTVIPEDHIDFAISSFRSNESRWESDKVSFMMTSEKYFEQSGFQQADRLGKLTFILANDRVMKERVITLMNKKSKLSILPEYDWLLSELIELDKAIPGMIAKGSFYAPCLIPMAAKINVAKDFSTEIKGLYVAGESAGVPGLLGAATSGCLAIDSITR